jgi:putative PepSY-like beta-lactamase-inhibitor
MKKNLFVFIIGTGISINLFAQRTDESKIPAAAVDAFKHQFPGSKGKWEKEKENYEVNFTKDSKAMSALIDAKGTILETETDISVNDLPPGIAGYVKAHYKGATIKEAARIIKPGGEIIYEAEVNKKDVLFDANGKFIKEEKD